MNETIKGLRDFLGIEDVDKKTIKDFKDWISKHDTLGNRIIISLIITVITFVSLKLTVNVNSNDFISNFAIGILGSVITIFLIEWFLNEREKRKKLVIRLVLEKELESIKYFYYDYLNAVLQQSFESKDTKLIKKTKETLLSIKPDYSHIQETLENFWKPFLIEYLLNKNIRLNNVSLRKLTDVATKLVSTCEKKMNLFGGIYSEETFFRLLGVLFSARALVNTIESYEIRSKELDKTRPLLFENISNRKFQKIKYESLKEIHDSICTALTDSLMELASLWVYMENLRIKDGTVDRKIIEFLHQARAVNWP